MKMMENAEYVIGLMSGTSADGVDAAILRTDGREIAEPGPSLFTPYSDGLRAEILAMMRGEGEEAAIAQALTDVHIQAVQELVQKTQIKPHLVAFHGQTIRHAPAEGITVQIGEPERMARELGIPVVADFRTNDVRHGGQGAPFVPLYHAALATYLPKPLMVVNIGGVSNVTWIGECEAAGGVSPPSDEANSLARVAFHGEPLAAGVSAQREGGVSPPSVRNLIAFDSGPGNALLDDWVYKHTGKRCDENGEIASRGVIDSGVVSNFLRNPFFLADAPKSLDRNQFDGILAQLNHLSLEDGAATLTSMTATSIALSFGAVPAAPKQVLITGGGRKNPFLMSLLSACVNAPVAAVETVGWDGDMLEAQAFAYLAARSVQGLPLSLPTTTGVKEPVTGGILYSPHTHHHHDDDDCTTPRSCCR